MDHGVSAGKLLLGFPTHSRSFTLSSSDTGVGAPYSGLGLPGPYTQESGVWSHYEVSRTLLSGHLFFLFPML